MDTLLDVKALRVALGLSQAQLGEAVGVDQSTVSNWENGKSPRGPARLLLQRLSKNSSVAPTSQESGAACPDDAFPAAPSGQVPLCEAAE
ncbi:helix-turn-helix domain-containing protein [Tianweitania sediminis]|uniref:Helix-turn-helix transcriptional regulator n=1 Tax=Tianweitania sediminis TaxID=1502156 RepID=A0A8J7QX93_9HYPH|nr:helix-turn-helix transcriptional regulator [Tianweitania sediminis]